MADRSLEHILQQLKHRGLMIGGASGFGWALFGEAVLWLAFAWLDLLWELAPSVRMALGPLAGVAGLGILVAGLWRASRAAQSTKMAHRLDRVAGTGGQILSGYDLATAPVPALDADKLTSGLARMATDRAAQLAERIQPQLALPRGRSRSRYPGRQRTGLTMRCDRLAGSVTGANHLAAVYRSVWRSSALFARAFCGRSGRSGSALRHSSWTSSSRPRVRRSTASTSCCGQAIRTKTKYCRCSASRTDVGGPCCLASQRRANSSCVRWIAQPPL